MAVQSPSHLSDRDLLTATVRVAESCRRNTADLIALLAEVDARKLYQGEGHSSLFTYCTQALHLSESAAYSRITAARVVRRLPIVLRMLADGDITLTTITLLGQHLNDENHEALLAAARHKGKREIEMLVASLDPQPDVPSSVRKLPESRTMTQPAHPTTSSAVVVHRALSAPQRAVVAPLAPERYLVKITVSDETRVKLDRARDLLSHVIPSGDPAAIVDRALTVLVEQLERTKQVSALV